MKIALLGYGKMGRMIEQTAEKRGHEISARIDAHNGDIDFAGAEVAIDFSTPQSAADNLLACFRAGIPAVCGTTGWGERYQEVKLAAEEKGGALVYSSNFSLGVNLFFELNRALAHLAAPYPQYHISQREVHHIHKLDAPSGTAITLAEGILSQNPRYTGWSLAGAGEDLPVGSIPIEAVRQGEVPGIHSVTYTSEVDAIEIRHEAFSREGFALGAVIAAEWIVGRRGIFSMHDVLFGHGKN